VIVGIARGLLLFFALFAHRPILSALGVFGLMLRQWDGGRANSPGASVVAQISEG
jgi:hypothetical protein